MQMNGLQAPIRVIEGSNNRTGVIIKWQVTAEAKDFIRNNEFDYLILDATEPGGLGDLGFLLDKKDKIRDITINNDEIDWDIINQLTSIRTMNIGGWFNCHGLDFRKLPELTFLETYWNKGYEDTLSNLKKLKALKIIGYKSESLEGLGAMPALQYMLLALSRNLTSLTGIERFKALKFLDLESCSQLVDIESLPKCTKLMYLILTKCNRLTHFEAIGQLKSLTELILGGDTQNIAWLKNLKHLEKLRLDCKLDNGNLDFLYDMENLQFVLFKNKKNYTVKIKDIQQYLEDKGHDQTRLRLMGHSFPEPRELIN